MKKLLLFMITSLWLMSSCKKEEKYVDPLVKEAPSFTEIKALQAQFTTNPIILINGNGEVLGPNFIILFQDSQGHIGKIKLLDLDSGAGNALVFDLVSYNADGTVFAVKKGIAIDLGYACDLKLGVQANGSIEDFFWSQADPVTRQIIPDNGAKFYLFTS